MLAVSLQIYFKYRYMHDGKRRSFLLFIFGVLASTFLTAMAAVGFVINVGCSGDSGALCSFGAAILVQPIAMLIGMGGYLYYWVKKRNTLNVSSSQ